MLSLLALLAVGCQPNAERVMFPRRLKTYQSVVSLSPSTTELIGSLAFNLRLAGRTAACDYPPQIKTAPVVAQVKPDYEKVKAANPGFVVYDADLYSAQDVAQIKNLGIDTFEFKAKTVEEFAQEVLKFGTLVGAEMESSAYADKVLDERKASMDDPANTFPTVVLLMPNKGGEHYIAGTKSFPGDLIRSSGGKLVGPEADKYVPIDAESLLKLNPDVIITSGKPDAVVADPRLKSLPAIQKLRINGVTPEYVARKGSRVEKAINMIHRAITDAAARK